MKFLERIRSWNSVWLYKKKLNESISAEIQAHNSPGTRWLDVGCGTRPYEDCFHPGTYTGIDIEDSGRDSSLKQPDQYYDGRKIPFPAASVDGILCTEVLEHVNDPESLLREISRVLKKGGGLIISAPMTWEEHEIPYDFYRFTRFGIAELLKRAGLEQLSLKKIGGSYETVASLAALVISQHWRLPLPGFGLLLNLMVVIPLQLVAMLMQKILPDRGNLYLGMVIVARKKSGKEKIK